MPEPLLSFVEEAGSNYLQEDGKGNIVELQGQLLIDLGYLTQEFLADFNLNREVFEAYKLFEQDLLHSGLVSEGELSELYQVYGEDTALKLLEKTLDMDEGFNVSKVCAFGQQDIVSRVVHYRLSIMGLYEGKVEQPFNAYSYQAIQALSKVLGTSMPKALELTADIHDLTKFYLNNQLYDHSLVSFDLSQAVQIPDYSGKFKRRLKRDLRDHDKAFDFIKDQVLYRDDKKVNEAFLRRLSDDPKNAFTIRLIQIHQWIEGTYEGTLDGELGDLTAKSLIDLITDFNESNEGALKTGEVLVRVKGDLCVFNALYFLKKYQQESNVKDPLEGVLSNLSTSLGQASEEAKAQFEHNFNNQIEEVCSASSKAPEKMNGFLKRVFVGIRGFFRKALKFSGKIFKWLVELPKRVLSFLKNFIKNIYNFIKQAVKHLIEGILFLIGKAPVMTVQDRKLHYSNFDFDKDAISILSSEGMDSLKMHMDKVNKRVLSMRFSLLFISTVMNLLKDFILAANPIGWPFFILKLIKSFKTAASNYKLIIQ